ncbi:MAG TPA: tetratricopeptide repeat protein, partial [Bryobacteraceae bacterium]|nr:tetratricopeptide repeat protein [Bryobacteraceae bacterium]
MIRKPFGEYSAAMPGQKAASRGRSWFLAFAAVAGGLAAWIYHPALRGGLLWDDDAHVTRPDLRSWGGLVRIWADLGATQQYYPVVHSAFWAEHRLWGDWTLPYHALNVALHVAASLLFVMALQRLWAPARGRGSGVPKGAEWLAGLIFAVHPVCVESVAWISEQKNTLSLVFYLLAGLAYLRFDRTRKPAPYWLGLGLYLAALGTKSVTATLPAALLVIQWWQKGRLSWRRDILPLAPWLALGLGAGLVTASVEQNLIGATGSGFAMPFWQRGLLAGRVIWFYLLKLAWPANLIFIYPRWDVAASATHWAGWLAAAAAVTAALWLWRERCRGLLAGWLFFVGSLFPALGFFNVYPFRYSYVADHFQYLPSLGLMALAAAGMAALWQRMVPAGRGAGWAIGTALVVTLAFLSHRQAANYRDGITLYRSILARNPNCSMAHNNLAIQLAKSPGNEAEAIAHYRQALRSDPGSAEIHYNLADSLAKVPGGAPEAIAQYEEALRLRPDYAQAHNNLALQLAKIPGRLPDAIAHYEAALRLDPGNAQAHNNLAAELANL